VDIDKDEDASLRYGIRSVPTTIIFKDGEIVGRVAGNNVKGIQEVIDSI
jgi:thioredoxin-like negative regulator of GroEL